MQDLSDADSTRALDALSSDDACVREVSVRIVGHQDDERIAAPLVAKLVGERRVAARRRGDRARARRAAAGGRSADRARCATQAVDVRANAAWALGRIENGRALAPLDGLFRDESPIVREAAVGAVGRLESTSAVAALLRVLQQDRGGVGTPRGGVGARASRVARGGAGARVGAGTRQRCAGARDDRVGAGPDRAEATGSAALQRALREDADDAVRETSAWALAQIEDRTAIDALGAAALSDRSSRVRGTAAWAIGQLRDDNDVRGRAPAALTRLLKDESEDVRRKAAWALGNVGDAASVPAIRDAMKVEQSSDVRSALVRALTKSGGRSEAVFTELLSSSDPKVREAAVRGLAGQNAFNPWPWPWPRPRPFP